MAQRIPPLARSLDAILREVDSDEGTCVTVGRLVASDPVLSGRVLRMAQSGFYSRGHRVVRAEDAVSRLGLRTVRNVALAASLRQLEPPATLAYDAEGFFLHCFTTASVAADLGRAHGLDADVLFLAGLMHDVGSLIDLPGHDHAVLGSVVAQHWKLPDVIVQIIASHHVESDAPLCRAVRFADRASDAAGVGLAVPVPFDDPDPMYAEALELVDAGASRAQEAYNALR